jgi:hypothetical protein
MEEINDLLRLILKKIESNIEPVDIELMSFALERCYKLAGILRYTTEFGSKYMQCNVMIQFAKNKDKYITLQGCEIALNSITPTMEDRQLTIHVLIFAISAHMKQEPERVKKLLEQLKTY